MRMRYHDTVADMAEALDIPHEALSGAVRIVLTGRRRALVEHHWGLLGYCEERVEVGAAPGTGADPGLGSGAEGHGRRNAADHRVSDGGGI